MTRYGLRARVITLTLAPTLIIGLLLSTFFSYNRYHDLEQQVTNSGLSIIEPLAIASERSMELQSREAVRHLISYAHRKNSNIVRSIAVFDDHHELFVTSNFHPNFESLTFPKNKPIPLVGSAEQRENSLILRAPILAENRFTGTELDNRSPNTALGYIAVELDLSSLRLRQYQELFYAVIVLLIGLGLSAMFAYRLMYDVSRPITNMKNMVDRIRRGHLDVRLEETFSGELDSLKNGINAMAVSLSEYHMDMQHSIDQATSDLRETLEQLEIQNVELDIAKKRAQEAARVKSEFLANMSHELRTPLNGVIGFTRQMLKTHLTDNQTDYLQTIENSANNLLKIINDILDFSKLEAGKLALENIPFDFQTSLDEVVSLQATSAHEKGLELTLRIDPNIPAGLVGDPMRIQQVLTNLVGNSIKFTERGNIDISVELRAHKEDSVDLQFMVRDTGIGISERQQAQLFQAFSQADASISRRYGGTGLGLVITQKLVSQMGGEISLTSRLHQGSTFWFTLRLYTTDLPVDDPIDTQWLQQRRALLIEKNIKAASVTQKILEQEGLQVSYRSDMPNEEHEPFDYLLLNLSPSQPFELEELDAWITQAKRLAAQVIVGIPSTQLALSDDLFQRHQVICLTKPLSRKKLLQQLISRDVAHPAPPPPSLPSEKLPLRVMTVDDNPANLKLITALLHERVSQVVTCSSGLEAIRQAEKQSFDMILMDIQMPQMDGVTACQNIKQLPLNANTPIIAVTAHAMSGERERLLKAGMDDYLTKPIEESVLQQVLLNWCPHCQTSSSSTSDPTQWSSTVATSHPAATAISPSASISAAASTTSTVIDWQAALQQSVGKEDLAHEMLQMLIDSLPTVQELVEHVLDNKPVEHDALLHHVHKLHGSCAYCGVPRLKRVCAALEHALRSGATIEEVEPELFELQEEMEKVVTTAQSFLSEEKPL